MNCEDFSQIIHEIADYKPMAATTRDAALSHVALCAYCAATLAEGLDVSRNLVMAAGAETGGAPARVKQNLLAAFDELHQTQHSARSVDQSNLVSILNVLRERKLRWLTAAATAIAAVILLAIILPNWRDAAKPELQPQITAGRIEPPASAVNTNEPAPPAVPAKSNVSVKTTASSPRVSKQKRFESRAPRSVETVAQNPSEYLALTYLAKSTAIDSGTVVRVELSRAALARLGLPVSFDHSSASLKADVIIGDDGVAQAIRLVQ